MKKFLNEVLFVGIITAVAGLFISTLFMLLTDKNFSLKKYHFWYSVMLSYFITGMVLHIMFEFAGFNKWYCKHGNACSKR